MNDITVEHFNNYGFQKGCIGLFTVYFNTSDYPEKYVVRLILVNKNVEVTPYIYVANTLEDVRKSIPTHAQYIPPANGDDFTIVESWMV